MHESSDCDGEAWSILVKESAAEWGNEEHAENCNGLATRFAQCEG
jgi:hypothetical protein